MLPGHHLHCCCNECLFSVTETVARSQRRMEDNEKDKWKIMTADEKIEHLLEKIKSLEEKVYGT